MGTDRILQAFISKGHTEQDIVFGLSLGWLDGIHK